MKHVRLNPRQVERINIARERSHLARAAAQGLMYGGSAGSGRWSSGQKFTGTLKDHLTQLKNTDYALIERRIMAHLS